MLGAMSTTNAPDIGTKPNGSALSTTNEPLKNDDTACTNKPAQTKAINNPITKHAEAKDDVAMINITSNGMAKAEDVNSINNTITTKNQIKDLKFSKCLFLYHLDAPISNHSPTCNKISEQSTLEKSGSTCSLNSSTCSFGDSERSEVPSLTHRAPPMHNLPLDNLSNTLSSASANKNVIPSELKVDKNQKPQPAQILVPSALNLNATLQPSLPQASLGSISKMYSESGKTDLIILIYLVLTNVFLSIQVSIF